MNSLVNIQRSFPTETFVAVLANVRSLSQMNLHVLAKIARASVSHTANFTHVRSFAGVNSFVYQPRFFRHEGIPAELAHVRTFGRVYRLVVISQRTLISQFLAALVALDFGLIAGVGAFMIRENGPLRKYLVTYLALPDGPVGGLEFYTLHYVAF